MKKNLLFNISTDLFLKFLIPCLFLSIANACNHSDSLSGKNPAGAMQQSPPDSILLARADSQRIHNQVLSWYDSNFRYSPLNGGMLVAKKGNIVFEVYNGTGHIPGTDTITSETPTQIASVSKTFTAMVILKLAEEKKIDIDEAFSKYFPDFNYPGVTIKTLLNHRSGLPNYLYFMDKLGWDKKKFMTNQDMYNWLVTKKKQITGIGTPDKRFEYCNTNYALLAMLIEKVTGSSYPDFMRDFVFKPLGMNNSFVYTFADSSRADPSYDWRGRIIPLGDLDLVYGDKNIYSTCRDLLKWDNALRTKTLFSDSLLNLAYTPYSNEHPGVHNYGLGWRMNVYPDGKKLIFHNGWWHGNNAVFIRMIPEDVTIIITGNKYNRAIYHAKNLVPLFNNQIDVPEGE